LDIEGPLDERLREAMTGGRDKIVDHVGEDPSLGVSEVKKERIGERGEVS
jgi:hypothetical protein